MPSNFVVFIINNCKKKNKILIKNREMKERFSRMIISN